MVLQKILACAAAAVTIFTGIVAAPVFCQTAEAAESYPVQKFRIGISNTNRNVCTSGTSDGVLLSSQTTSGTDREKWTLNYISDGVYEIVSAATGYVMTNSGSSCTIAKDTDAANQRWEITGTEKDFDGYFLYYKIVSHADTTQALTFSPETNTFSTAAYNGGNDQKFKLNLDGLEGFAANCQVTEGEKAGTIGGLLGKTVTVSTVADFKEALNSTEPLTVVVNGNLDMASEYHTRIRDNKTIVGSYNANQIQDCMLRTNNEYGTEGDEPSDNIVIRNINFLAKNVEDRILINIWSSRNIWIDHCTFNSELIRDRDEVGKFIWINTPYDSYLDAKDRLRSPDYITLSYNIYRNRYWTVAYGTQNTETTRCRTSIMYCWWDACVRRCAQIGNGFGHFYNNYHSGVDSGIPNGCSQMIAGEGSTVLSENCRFQSLKGVEVAVDSNGKYRDSGSYTADSSTSTPYSLSKNLPSYTSHTWNPSTENYGYSLLSGYASDGNDVKSFCQTYSGCFNSENGLKYITDEALSSSAVTHYDAPFLKDITVGTPTTEKTGTVMDTSVKYMFQNVGSGMYMEVQDAAAQNNANVQQWGADGEAAHNTWKLIDAGDGYYYIRSCVGDGKTYYLDLENGKSADGTNIGIYAFTDSDAQKFKFVNNGDGTYTITTKPTKDASCLGIASDATSSGASVVQWQCNGKDSQKWKLTVITIKDGAVLDESACYMIQNKNSGQYMEVQDGKAETGANVQQWGADTAKPSAHNVWHVKAINWGYYYIYSALGDGTSFLLDVSNGVNGSNITIAEKNNQSTQYFKFVDNEDGTYTIVTRASKDSSCVEVADASKHSGANVQQWEWNENDCQKWVLQKVDYTLPQQTVTTPAVTTIPSTSTTTASSATAAISISTAASQTESTVLSEAVTETKPVGSKTVPETTAASQIESTVLSETVAETKPVESETVPQTTAANHSSSSGESHASTASKTTASQTETTSGNSAGTGTTATAAPSATLYGDINLDGKIDIVDAVLLNKAVAGAVVLNEAAWQNADCDANGTLSINDSSTLLRFLVHLIKSLPDVS